MLCSERDSPVDSVRHDAQMIRGLCRLLFIWAVKKKTFHSLSGMNASWDSDVTAQHRPTVWSVSISDDVRSGFIRFESLMTLSYQKIISVSFENERKDELIWSYLILLRSFIHLSKSWELCAQARVWVSALDLRACAESEAKWRPMT